MINILVYAKQIMELAVALFLIAAIILMSIAGRRIGTILEHADGAIANVDRTTDRARAYLDFQTDLLQSAPYQKSLKASLEAPAVFNGTGRLVNTQLIPRAMKTLDSLNVTLQSLSQNSASLNQFIIGLDRNVNVSLLPETTRLLTHLTATAQAFQVTIDDLNQAITMASAKTGKSLDVIYELLARPEIIAILKHTETTSANIEQMTGSMAEALKRAPSLAESLDHIAKTSSRFTKITLISGLIGTLARAFLR